MAKNLEKNMLRNLTDKQKSVALEVAKGKNPLDSVEKFYNCGGKNPRASARVILSKLRANERFNEELATQETLVKEIRYSESKKLADILAEMFPRVERARILIEIAKTGSAKEKIESLKEINRVSDEYPKTEDVARTQIGELKILMVKPEPKRLKEPEESHIIDIEESGGEKDEKNKDSTKSKEEQQ